ncbi:MAG: PhzF family phenazine biosynthesis protein [Chloroflexi bacterium]|nr:PhzF family phenazine biosynthesis protein [Chloroflexota bacterium]
MTATRTIRHVDAFTTTPLHGNPAAVVDGEGLSPETMQRIALNQHLSETVFLLPPRAPEHHAHIRIFTPGTELPFAGHPTIAASHILISEGRVALAPGAPLLLETGAGVIPVVVSGEGAPLYTMTQASPQFRPSEHDHATIAASVGLQPQDILRAEQVSTGIFWLIAQVASLEAMMRVQPDMMALMKIPHGLSIFCIGAQSSDADIHVRAFAPDAGVFEDPVTGSSNGCTAAFIAKHALMPARGGEITYTSEQGLEMGQPGRVHLRVSGLPDALSVHVGGHAVTVLRGELLLPAP